MNYLDITKVDRFKDRVEKLGLKIVPYRFDSGLIQLSPLDDHWPSYVRDAIVVSGTVESINLFLDGMDFMKSYLENNLRLVTDKKIEQAEDKIRNRQLARRLMEA
jgi:hypothetical protein